MPDSSKHQTLKQKAAHSSQEENWSVWAAAAQTGDKAAYQALLRDISPFIKAVLVPKLADPDWADDIAQEVLMSVHRALHTYSADKAFKPWLLAIVNYRKTDFLRKHYSSRKDRQTSLDDPDFIGNHVTNSAFAGEYKDIERFLADLPEKQRVAFVKMRVEGYTAKEVAAQMNMSESAVKVSVHRATKLLHEQHRTGAAYNIEEEKGEAHD